MQPELIIHREEKNLALIEVVSDAEKRFHVVNLDRNTQIVSSATLEDYPLKANTFSLEGVLDVSSPHIKTVADLLFDAKLEDVERYYYRQQRSATKIT